MKTIQKALLALIPAVLFVSCGETDPEDPDNGGNGGANGKDKTDIHMIDVLPLYELAADKDTALIRFTVTLEDSDADWSISSSADWCKAEPASGKGLGEVNIIVTDNPTASERKADVVISAGKNTHIVKVSQCLYAGAMPDESWFSKPYYDRTDREKAGLRGPVKSWYNSTYTTYDKYYYDEAGHLVKEESYDTSDNSMEVDWVHSYDAQGRRIKSEQSFVHTTGLNTKMAGLVGRISPCLSGRISPRSTMSKILLSTTSATTSFSSFSQTVTWS